MTVLNEDFWKAIGARLKNLRTSANLTQIQMVEKLSNEYYTDIDEKTIRRYESAEYPPTLDKLIAICDLFDVTMDFVVFGKQTSDDNLFTWNSSLRRLARLIYCMVLVPQKESNPKSPHYGKYYFESYDEETKVFLDRLNSYCANKNYDFEVWNKCLEIKIQDWDSLIGDLKDINEDLSPSMKRMIQTLRNAKIDPELFVQQKHDSIVNKRKV